MDKTAKPRVSRSTLIKRRNENIAKGFIWGSAGLTIGILFFIVAFIVVRGFYSRGIYEYDVISLQEASVDGWTLVVNKKIDEKELPFERVAGIFSGDFIDWAKLSEQEYELRPLLPSDGHAEALAALGVSASDESPLVESYDNAGEAFETVAADYGAAALVRSADAEKLPKGVKTLKMRRVSIAANPSVTKIVGNDVLRALEPDQRKRLFSGEVSNWKEIGGINLPVTLVLPPADSPLGKTLAAHGEIAHGLFTGTTAVKATVLRTSSMEAFAAALETTEGAAGYWYWSEAKKARLPIVRAQRLETGPNLSLSFLLEKPRMSGRVGGISTIIVNTLYMIILTLLIATPIGVFAAVYLVEYAKQSRLVTILRLGTETLAGIPSIIFGLFGMLFFVGILGWGIGLLSGVLTLTLMILPTIVRTSEEALKTVQPSLREGSLALGATKLQTVLKVVVPAASPGILTGVILAIGRAVGETAALIFTMGSSYDAAKSLFASSRVLAVHIYLIVAEGISLDKAFATATILVFVILLVNIAATRAIGRFNKMSGKQ